MAMHKLYVLKLFSYVILISLVATQPLYAVSESLVISQIQTGDKISAKNEFVEIYNNSTSDQEVTDWCLYYQSASLVQGRMVCITPSADNFHVFMPSKSYLLAVSNELSVYDPFMIGDMKFSYTLLGSGGYVKLVDGNNNEIDKVGWGTSPSDSNLALAPSAGNILGRKTSSEDTLQDTDINGDDFEITLPRQTYSYGALYEIEDVCSNLDGVQESIPDGYESDENHECVLSPVDVCTNLDGLQEVLPVGYSFDEESDCQPDICANIDGLQTAVPDGLEIDGLGNCVQYDACLNLDGIQSVIPDGYVGKEGDTCAKKITPIGITELLPNAVGSDDGNEFVELFNPNDEDIDLNGYKLFVGTKAYDFPSGFIIKAGGYAVLYDDEMGFTLVNTAGNVSIKSVDESFVGETINYYDAKEGLSWTLISGIWQYTNRPTPGLENLPSIAESVTMKADEFGSDLKPCSEGEYRNPETNRCRKIVTDSESTLVPCKQGQYRDEQTNRCRNIASDVAAFMPCAEGQERNPATNRCRTVASVLGASTALKPCPAGQERNPATNRCRKIAAAMPTAAYAVKKTAKKESNPVFLWSLVGIGLVAAGYGIWEWRKEISRLIVKIRPLFTKAK